jgi:prolyl oligopeptidase PreP (S9A serine peptidase family)
VFCDAQTKQHLILTTLNNVKSELVFWKRGTNEWRQIMDGSSYGGGGRLDSVSVRGVDADHSDSFFLTREGFISPTSLSLVAQPGAQPSLLQVIWLPCLLSVHLRRWTH